MGIKQKYIANKGDLFLDKYDKSIWKVHRKTTHQFKMVEFRPVDKNSSTTSRTMCEGDLEFDKDFVKLKKKIRSKK